ncbi:ABC transporter permease [Magnetospira sp. QH-2]|uniref:ABC transporter permease n=1 Tax=Magnetospira sp. (strain QH-2) TaxID=1288970 RepID=UPI0003E8141C|nr:ABC transporter permease [Magnetospira sp. QH-2]CCQ73669.1 Dipeptide transport system permease protein DppC [Magnetospira sp. QH-2]
MTPIPDEMPEREPFRDTPLGRFLQDFFSNPVAVIGLAGFLLVAFIAIFAPWIAPQDPYDLAQLDFMDGNMEPGAQAAAGFSFLLGSDDQGRDILSGIMYGLRTSLAIGAASAFIALSIGAAIGLVSAWFGGRTDTVIMRLVEVQMSFPAVLIALVLLAILGQGVEKIIIALVLVQWAYYARTIRGLALVEKNREYIDAARCLRYSQTRIIFGHLLPNCMPPLIVIVTMQVAHAIALEATLSFLGIGVPITEPSLGLLISNGFHYMQSGRYWLSFFPGLALLFTIVSINLVGDHLRDILNPRTRAQ